MSFGTSRKPLHEVDSPMKTAMRAGAGMILGEQGPSELRGSARVHKPIARSISHINGDLKQKETLGGNTGSEKSYKHNSMRTSNVFAATIAALIIGALPHVAGHGDAGMDMSASASAPSPLSDPNDGWQVHGNNYFMHGHYTGWILAHIVLMVLAWVLSLPLAIMLSAARSRYHIPAQVLFHALNSVALVTGFVYNHSTPDLYKHNAHHPIGWVVISLTIVWTLASLYTAYGDYQSRRETSSLSSGNTARYSMLQDYGDRTALARWSHDSAMGSSCQHSSESVLQKPEDVQDDVDDDKHEDNEDEEPEKRGFLGNNRVDRFMSHYAQRLSTPRASTLVRGGQIGLEKVLMILGFAALSTGFLTYGGLGRSKQVFSVAAHFVKGGIFFWYGVLTLGRWMGAFSEFGWAWNIRPDYPLVARWKTRMPSAEFTESFVIWLYGASNVFLEHLNNAGGEWHPQDFEHLSITALFFGGGLLGMLIDSAWFRKQLNTSVVLQRSQELQLPGASRFAAHGAGSGTANVPDALWQEPATYKVPLNPMPALVIMALGIMMSSHHQTSMVSTMMHAQWGTLFFAFAIARAATYLTLYLKPPTSHFPCRPPSELVSAFCLMCGGLMFMVSAHDTVWAIETSGLDAMTIFTVTLGLTGILMSWEVVCYAIKGWAVRKEIAALGRPLP
ncbi:hypothetical protein LTR56_014970 [Elasticomyces elasticus]|nr:hypothetical protein LTR22_025621 [Elasticomyces elasticus]KAK3635006.1 hypothetical protein LTR56_014970 [Elasticomyces elasticus]